MSGRGVLEIAKATGTIDIVPGVKLFAKKYFEKGRIINLDSTHWAEVKDEIPHCPPFVFVVAGEISGGEPKILECENEDKAILFIEMFLEEEIKIFGGINI
ncbi:MAG: hypothetical protein LBI06_03820 [Treponema sp.]|nr:hypothetical protein [Treponema sp.]